MLHSQKKTPFLKMGMNFAFSERKKCILVFSNSSLMYW